METVAINECDGIAGMRSLIKEFLNRGEGSPQVREFLASAFEDDFLLLIYLKGRKYRVKYAFETLKRKAEVRFDEYPDSFPDSPPEEFYTILRHGIMGILKARDKFGRRILYFNAGKWDPSLITLNQLTTAGTYYVERLLRDKDMMNNGLVMVQDCAGMGIKQAKEYSLQAMLRQINIFCYASPIKFKGAYYLNVPFYAPYLFKLMKPFLSKKLKERLVISSSDQKYNLLHEAFLLETLPTFLGGINENDDAFDWDLFHLVN